MKIGIFGLGYIGFSTAAWFANAGVEVIGTDIDEKKVDMINSGQLPVQGIEPVLPDGFWEMDLITATTDWGKVVYDDTLEAVFIAVPTEKEGNPWWMPLKDVIGKIIVGKRDPLIIIESTMAVGTVDKYVLKRLSNVAVAPRRDWFTEPTRNLKTLPRIVGGTTEEVTKRAIDVLSVVCDTLLPTTHREAELVKAYENAYRHVTCVLAQEMALGFPSMDIRNVLELGGTKWNVESMYPNMLGVGGYCVPLASQYILEGAEKPHELTILQQAVERDNFMAYLFAGFNATQYEAGDIAVLGLAYLGNIKVNVLSPLMRLLKHVHSWKFRVHDSLYTEKEIMDITGCPTFDFPEDLDKFKVVLLLAGHEEYSNVSVSRLVQKTENCEFIFDNTGLWKDIEFKCPYYLSGQAGWMESLKNHSLRDNNKNINKTT